MARGVEHDCTLATHFHGEAEIRKAGVQGVDFVVGATRGVVNHDQGADVRSLRQLVRFLDGRVAVGVRNGFFTSGEHRPVTQYVRALGQPSSRLEVGRRVMVWNVDEAGAVRLNSIPERAPSFVRHLYSRHLATSRRERAGLHRLE